MGTIRCYTSEGRSFWSIYETGGQHATYTAALMPGGIDRIPISHYTFPNLTLALHRAGVTEIVAGCTSYLDGRPMP